MSIKPMLENAARTRVGMRFIALIDKYPDKNWHWGYISASKNITMDVIRAYPNKPWSWDDISINPNITMEFIEENIDKDWNWKILSCNSRLKFEFAIKHIDKDWDWGYVARHSIIPENFFEIIDELIEKYPQIKHIWNELSLNKNIKLETIRMNSHRPWNWRYITNRKDLTLEYAEAHGELPWEYSMFHITEQKKPTKRLLEHIKNKKKHQKGYWYLLSYNQNVPFKIILEYIDCPWDWNGLSNNLNIPIQFIENNLDKGWNWQYISSRTDINQDFIKRHINKLDISQLSCNPAIDIEFIKNYPGFKWVWGLFTYNPKVDVCVIEENPDIPWSWDRIDINPNLTINFIDVHSDEDINWTYISKYHFDREYEVELEKLRLRYSVVNYRFASRATIGLGM
jgi:hypothetical protein